MTKRSRGKNDKIGHGWVDLEAAATRLKGKKNTRSIMDGGNKIVRRRYDPNCRACMHDSRAMH